MTTNMNPLKSEPNKVTIFDVAKLAGVSPKTVSRVANNQPNVRVATRERVQMAIDALNYQANPYARYLNSLRRSSIAAADSA